MRVTKPKSNKGLLAGIGVGIVALAIAAGYLASRESDTAAGAAPVDAGMALIAAGTYMIGSNDEPSARPAHQVTLGAFGLDTTEVTVADYDRFVQARRLPAPWSARPDSTMPVTGVLLAEAQSFCAWRHADGGRLPSEEEWEAAARGLEGRKYAWGRDWKPDAANVNNQRTGPAPVGSYPGGRTPDGIHDLIGNVWEWTSSPHRPYGNPDAPASGMYVIRGGGFSANPAVATAVSRIPYDPATDRRNLAGTGFRCAMTARSAAR